MCIRTILPMLLIAAAIAFAVNRRERVQNRSQTVSVANNEVKDAAPGLRALDSAATRPSLAGKQWALDFPAYVNSHPGQWIVGHCGQPCLSEEEAAQMARADAADEIFPRVQHRLSASNADAVWLRGRILADIQGGELQSDHLVEQFSRPYGTVWTESVLLEASPQRIQNFASRYSMELRLRHARTAVVRIVALGAIVMAWCICWLLNLLTKGYFATRLKLSAALVTALAIAVMV
jgi:hypothetical protein